MVTILIIILGLFIAWSIYFFIQEELNNIFWDKNTDKDNDDWFEPLS